MTYVFDTSSLSQLKHFYPAVFKTIWTGLDNMVQSGALISTREVFNEIERGEPHPHVSQWLKARKQIFTIPTREELLFVAEIFKVPHFRSLIGERQRWAGTPVADPFVIACAKRRRGTVVTEERLKPNAAKIPNVCEYFGIGCINLEQFMQEQGWSF